MKTLTHSAGTRVVTGSLLESEVGAMTTSDVTCACTRPATRTHAAGIPTISRTWLDSDFGAMNQYPVHVFAKKHHSQRAKPT